jgi:hypothetical protein
MSKSNLATVSLVLVSSLLLAACQAPTAMKKDLDGDRDDVATSIQAPSAAVQPSLAVAPDSKVASTETTYQSPGGEEKVGFKLVVNAQGIITDAQTETFGDNPTTKMRQASFAKSFPEAVKGKKLSELTKIDRVGGSSLTTGAFNKALDQLKASIKS